MNQTSTAVQREVLCKAALILLTLLSLVFSLIGSIVYISWMYTGGITTDHSALLLAFIPLLSWLLSSTPKFLLLLYILIFFRRSKAAFLVPVIYVWPVVSVLLSVLTTVLNGRLFTVMGIISDLITVVTFTLAFASALRGLTNKALVIIPAAFILTEEHLMLLSNAVNLFSDTFIANDIQFLWISNMIDNTASIFFMIALLLFGAANRIPALIQKKTAFQPAGDC